MLTLEEVQSALPAHLKRNVGQEFVDQVNNATSDPDAARAIRDNFISYSVVLRDGKFKMEDYLNAVTYVSFKLMGYSNREAYVRTFPQRYQDHVAKGATDKDIGAYVAVYNRGKMVNLVLEQTIIPSWILNQDAYQKAINVQVELMTTANSEKVRAEAANSILTHLKKPETKKVQLDVSAVDNSGMNELNETLRRLAEQQQSLIEKGVPTQEIAHQKIITRPDIVDADFVEVAHE